MLFRSALLWIMSNITYVSTFYVSTIPYIVVNFQKEEHFTFVGSIQKQNFSPNFFKAAPAAMLNCRQSPGADPHYVTVVERVKYCLSTQTGLVNFRVKTKGKKLKTKNIR